MKELVALFRKVESSVRAPAVLRSPEPSKVLNDEPPIFRFVVDAVVNDAYVVEEKLNV